MPVVLDDLGKNNYVKLLAKQCKNKLQVQYKGKLHYRITTYSEGDYKKVYESLKQDIKKFYTFPQKGSEFIKIVAAGIPPYVTSDEIYQGLIIEFCRIEKAIQMTKTNVLGEKIKLPVFVLFFHHEQDMARIRNKKHLAGYAVKWDKYRSNGNITQCYNCQNFGHTSSYCNLQNRCVKCTKPHEAFSCPKTRAEPAQCINCLGNHPANFKSCPKLLEIKARREQLKIKARQNVYFPAPAPLPLTRKFNAVLQHGEFPALPERMTNTLPLPQNPVPSPHPQQQAALDQETGTQPQANNFNLSGIV
ncbi:uncharacterized protein LOC113385508 [Ctenocephalides felis]|uniref:uncharacterized protein LOC113385508 n=1 Tax=Ctenocephalides felis TaxID=7515 RepID=UPI000E6E5AA2|nr:uncharacterized protein LOC113385508 [Ctenocephalides felis]